MAIFGLGRVAAEFCRDEDGATAIEYAMIASMLSIAIMTAMLGVNGTVGSMFDDVYSKVSAALIGDP